MSALPADTPPCRRVTACVAGSVFKAQMRRDVQLDITGKQSEVVLAILTDTTLQAAVKEEDLQRRASLFLEYSLVFANSRSRCVTCRCVQSDTSQS